MEKINLVKLLKNCPEGMELDCTMFDNVQFINVEEDDKPICIRTGDIYRYLTKFGTWTFDENAKCVIFPKGKTTWEGFVPPCRFKNGDIIYINGFIAILCDITESGIIWYYCYYSISKDFCKIKTDYGIGNVRDNNLRLATEEEKQKLFDAIKANNCKWNPETKRLEKFIQPKFKVGNKVKHKCDKNYPIIPSYTYNKDNLDKLPATCELLADLGIRNWKLSPMIESKAWEKYSAAHFGTCIFRQYKDFALYIFENI